LPELNRVEYSAKSLLPISPVRAARDYLDTKPEFAFGSAMAALRSLSEGWGYAVTSTDVVEAYHRAMEAASRLNKIDDVTDQILQLVEAKESASTLFVQRSLRGRMRMHLSSANET
jgi:DNA segregation ATPase FtsK/SpoIIIE-like protein